MEETNILPTLLTHSDKAFSGALLVFFLVKLQPLLNKLVDAVGDLKESSDRRERQSDETQKEVLKLVTQIKYSTGRNRFQGGPDEEAK